MDELLTGFLTVEYDDGDASTYKGLKLSFNKLVTDGPAKATGEKNFNTGDPLIDWYDYCKYIYNGEAEKDGVYVISHSSNVDHWFMDTDEYVEKFLKQIDDEKFDFMSSEETHNLSLNELRCGLRCVVNKNMTSFQELKDYYNSHKK